MYVQLANEIYNQMRKNIDIIQTWFQTDNKEFNEKKLFEYEKYPFSPVLETGDDIYVFVRKLINNILYGKKFNAKNLNYIESNFISLVNIVIENYNQSSLKR